MIKERNILINCRLGFELDFYNKSGTYIANGYTRVVIGKRGPYVEFEAQHLIKANIFIPEEEKKRLTSKIYYYVEFRTNDSAYTKIYYQKKLVKYADYKLDLFYISPIDLYTKDLKSIINQVRPTRFKFS